MGGRVGVWAGPVLAEPKSRMGVSWPGTRRANEQAGVRLPYQRILAFHAPSFRASGVARKIVAMDDTDQTATEAGDGDYLFDAVLYPHRSLGPRGFALLMAAIALVGFGGGLAFLLAGAWPVFGFLGLDVALIYWAFKASYRSGRAHEVVRLTERELTVERVAASGRSRRWSFQPYWLRIEIDDPPEHASQLVLASHGRHLSIGSFLTPQERGEFAAALRQALAKCQ